MSRAAQGRKGGASGGPAVSGVDVLRMNIASLERARAAGDDVTAARCLLAMGRLVEDMRAQHGGGQPDLGEDEVTTLSNTAVVSPRLSAAEHEAVVCRLTDADFEEIARRNGGVMRAAMVGAPPSVDYERLDRGVRRALVELLPPRPRAESDWRLLVVLPWRWVCAAGRIVRRAFGAGR